MKGTFFDFESLALFTYNCLNKDDDFCKDVHTKVKIISVDELKDMDEKTFQALRDFPKYHSAFELAAPSWCRNRG